MKTQHGTRTEVFEAVADEFTHALRNGDDPSIESFAENHPDVADKIRLLFPMLAMMERGEPSSDQLTRFEDALPVKQPERLGDFLIEREIGRGGMGVVYQALQESLGRRVALKLLAQNVLDERSTERFEQEARTVANLHHTNIVPVYGIGQHEGHAYFVMQYIEGQSLDRVLVELQKIRGVDTLPDDNLSQSARTMFQPGVKMQPGQSEGDTGTLRRDDTNPIQSKNSESGFVPGSSHYWINVARVGRQIASALSYAHGQKILHRDIKPSNMILDEAGSVWVTDFGLARSIDSDRLTRTGEVVGTLRYMPPEQMSGKSDVRSDVYGLGLTLYEMLTFCPANDESDHRALIAQVTDGEPTPPRRIDSRIPRDLETIVLKCMAHEPDKRYQSAEAVHADLTRFVSGEPIHARRISATERVLKWAKRRPAAAAMASLALLFLVLGIAGITWKWREADRNLQEARKQNEAREVYFSKLGDVIDQMLARVGSETLADVPYMSEIRKDLLNDALVFYRGLQEGDTDDPALQIEFARIQRQMGDIHISLGELDAARHQLTLAIEKLEELGEKYPDKNLLLHWADCKSTRANLMLATGNHDEAEQELEETIRELDLNRDDFENPVGLLQVAAEAHMYLGIVRQSTKGNKESRESLEQALEYFDEVTDDVDLVTPKLHATCLELLARLLERTNQIPRAQVLRNDAVLIMQDLALLDPDSPDIRNRLAALQQGRAGIFLNEGKLEEAKPIILETIETRRELVEDFPFPSFYRALADSLSLYAGTLESLGDFESALAAGEESIEICERLVSEFPDNVIHQHSLARNNHMAATTVTRMGQKAEQLELANQFFEKAWNIYVELTEAAPRDQAYQYEKALVARNWSNTLNLPDVDAQRGTELLQDAIEILATLNALEPENTTYIYQLAFCRTNLGKRLTVSDPERAAQEFEASGQSLEQLVELQANDPRHRMQVTRVYGELAQLQFRNGDFEACSLSLEKACRNMEETVSKFGRNPNLITFLSISQNQYGHCLKVQGKVDEAEELFRSALADRQAFMEAHPDSDFGRHHLASSHCNMAWHLSFWRAEDRRDLDAALEHALSATEVEPESSGAWTCLAFVYLRRGEYENVLNSLKDLDNGVDDEMGQLAIRAIALWHLSREDEAKAAAEKSAILRASEEFQNHIPARLRSPELARLVDEANDLVATD